MKSRIPLFVLAIILAFLAYAATAADTAPRTQRAHLIWPRLTKNLEPELCARVLASTEDWFASTSVDLTELRATKLKARTAAPIEGRTDLPLDPEILALDIDGDHSDEVLLVTTTEFRMEEHREGFILRSPSDIDAVVIASFEMEQGANRDAKIPDTAHVIKPEDREEPGYWSLDPRTVYEWHGRYFLASVFTHSAAQPGMALQRLDVSGNLSTVCQVMTDDAQRAAIKLRDLPEIHALLAARQAIGHSGEADCGTSGFGYRAELMAADAELIAAVRPWAMTGDFGKEDSRAGDSRALWEFLENWSFEDPWNRREYLTLLESLEPARRSNATYLQKYFGLDAKAARVNGERAIDSLVASRFWLPAEYGEGGERDEASHAPEKRLYPDYATQLMAEESAGRVNAFGKTSLMTAVHMNRIDIVRALLALRADPNAITHRQDGCGYNVQRGLRSPIMYAAENASPLVMKLLLDAGARAGVEDNGGMSTEDYLSWNPRLMEDEKHMPIRRLAAMADRRADSPGFECSAAHTHVEVVICASEALRLLDAEMTDAYRRALPIANASLKSDQRKWAARREKACAAAGDDYQKSREILNCLADFTAARERYLQYLVAH